MSRYCAQFFIYNLLFLLFAASSALAADERKVVIPFDFESKFDDGRYGQMLGEMFWKKISREGGFVVPESMMDVRDFCAARNIRLSPDMDLERVRKIVEGDFGAQIGIWGSVERAAGAELDEYILVIKCVDFSVKPNPKVIAEVSGQTKSVSEIPHVYVKQVLDALYERAPEGPKGPNPIAEENWAKNPNLIIGDFERGAGGVPKGWDRVCGQQREPLGKLVRWAAEEGNPQNKVIRFTLDRAVAEFEGVMYYSDWFPVEEGATYRFQCRWRTNGPWPKVFIKCYDEEDMPWRTAAEANAASGGRKLKKDDYVPEEKQRREVYRSQQNLKGPPNVWNTQTEDFTPKHVKYSPKWGRVMLYAYHDPGIVEFDDVVVKQIVPASPGENAKVRRHSAATKVTIDQMRENERRSREAKSKK